RRRLEAVRESSSYPTVLRALLRECLTALPAAAVLRVDPRDERLAADLLGELGAELEIAATLETAGGLELARREDRGGRNTVEERSRELVDLLLSRFDLQNLLALLRGRVRGQPPEQVLANVVPLGALGGAAAQEIARQQELARAVDLLVSWRLPDPAGARVLAG